MSLRLTSLIYITTQASQSYIEHVKERQEWGGCTGDIPVGKVFAVHKDFELDRFPAPT